MARSPLTETYKRVEGMVTYVQQNLSGDEYNLFLDMVAPESEPVPAAKKTRKKRTTKSAKAQSLENAISRSPNAKRSADPCAHQYAKDSPLNAGLVCNEFFENGIHDATMGYAGYHPFVPPAQSARRRSSRKAAAASAPQSTEIDKGAAMSAGS